MATRVQSAAASTEKKKPVAKAAPAVKPPVKKAAVKPAARAAAKPAPAPKAAPAAKPAAAPKPPKAVEPVKAEKKSDKLEKPAKAKKVKQVRDSFTMPENEYAVLAQVKKSCLKAGVEIKKSDLLRIGVSLIKNLKIAELKDILASLTPLKVGRPKK